MQKLESYIVLGFVAPPINGKNKDPFAPGPYPIKKFTVVIVAVL
jgi:hypothetical protein